MMNNTMLLGLAALVAVVVVVLFMSGEMKNKSTFSTNGHAANQGVEVARASLDTNSGKKSLFSQLFGKLDIAGAKYEDQLYAQGGGYATFNVPYGKDETDMQVGQNVGNIQGNDWVKKFEKNEESEKPDSAPVTRVAAHQAYSNPYAPNKSSFVKTHSKMHGGNWYKKFDPSGHLVANRHTRHPATAGH